MNRRRKGNEAHGGGGWVSVLVSEADGLLSSSEIPSGSLVVPWVFPWVPGGSLGGPRGPRGGARRQKKHRRFSRSAWGAAWGALEVILVIWGGH